MRIFDSTINVMITDPLPNQFQVFVNIFRYFLPIFAFRNETLWAFVVGLPAASVFELLPRLT